MEVEAMQSSPMRVESGTGFSEVHHGDQSQPPLLPRTGARPIVKLSVGLLETYKHINEVYYEAQKSAANRSKKNKTGASSSSSSVLSSKTRKKSGGDVEMSTSTTTSVMKTSSADESSENWDDENSDYRIKVGDCWADQYDVISVLGKGSFGQVVKAWDRINNEYVAVKIIKSRTPFYNQAKIEISLLEHMARYDPENKYYTVVFKRHFTWRQHLCLVFELLSFNLYELLKNTGFHGVSLSLVRKFGYQILLSLWFLKSKHIDIIHCDLKPENILLKNPKRSAIKVIDYGSSCHSHQRMYKYIQSRFYRSPEVVLELPYSHAIDMWSLGAVLVELHTGEPIFPARNEYDLIFKMVEVLGMPPDVMIQSSSKAQKFFAFRKFDGGPTYKLKYDRSAKGLPFSPKPLEEILGVNSGGPSGRRVGEEGHSPSDYQAFVDLLKCMFEYDPAKRISPEEALKMKFFEGVPIPANLTLDVSSVSNRGTLDINIEVDMKTLVALIKAGLKRDEKDHLEKEKGKGFIVLNFWAEWCKPCGQMNNIFEKLAEKHSGALKFLKVDAEELDDVAEKYGVSAVPTFVFLKSAFVKHRQFELTYCLPQPDLSVLDRVDGASAADLTQKTQKHAAVSPSSAVNASIGGGGLLSEEELNERLKKLVNYAPIMLFMKGTPEEPKCGFSRKCVALLDEQGAKYESFDILSDEAVRQGLKKFSNWPTYPQLYISGKLIGGLDILKEMAEEGELKEALQTAQKEKEDKLNARLKSLIEQAKVVLFMKGDRVQPQCGFSAKIVEILNETGVEYTTFNILADNAVRQGLKKYSNWPTYPQLYVDGALIGGLDIVKELKEDGDLQSTLKGEREHEVFKTAADLGGPGSIACRYLHTRFEVPKYNSLSELKIAIEEQTGVPAKKQKLIVKGMKLENNDDLAEFFMRGGNKTIMVLGQSEKEDLITL